ncbi:Uncharacterised protein [Bordetella pertussis]|nr:Uncharacterised protein [Bordetella pertussis]
MSAPILPPAPERFSTMTDCPSSSPRRAPSMRATTSVAPPAGKGTMMRMGLSG